MPLPWLYCRQQRAELQERERDQRVEGEVSRRSDAGCGISRKSSVLRQPRDEVVVAQSYGPCQRLVSF